MRLFVAIDLPPVEKQALERELERLAAFNLPIRWLASDSLHITLKFLGEVPETRLTALRGSLQRAVAHTAAFEMTVGEFGAFPSLSRPSLFWVGANGATHLLELQKRVDSACVELGFPAEDRTFKPHITVGRMQSGKKVRDRAVMDRMAGEFKYKAKVRVASVELMRSHLGPRGSRYEALESVELE